MDISLVLCLVSLQFFCSQVPRQFLGLGWCGGNKPSLPADRLQGRACILAGQPDQVPALSGLKTFSQNISREKLDALECPVCLCPASAPIYACPESHIICSNCLPRYLLLFYREKMQKRIILLLKVVTVWRLQGGPPQHPGWPGRRIPISILTVIFSESGEAAPLCREDGGGGGEAEGEEERPWH